MTKKGLISEIQDRGDGIYAVWMETPFPDESMVTTRLVINESITGKLQFDLFDIVEFEAEPSPNMSRWMHVTGVNLIMKYPTHE